MVRLEFTMFISKLSKFYERKLPADGTMDLWFDVIGGIPSEEIQTIYDHITKENDAFPRNVTGAMWAHHYELRAAKGIAEATKVYKPCDYCKDGLLLLEKENASSGFYGRYVFRCDQCKQRKEAYPWGNLMILLNQGYREYPVLIPGAEMVSNMYELREFLSGWIAQHTIPDLTVDDVPF